MHGVRALQRARSAGWLTTYEFEEALLKLFTQSAAAALTSTTPSLADSTSGGLGAQVATATARDTELLCGPSPISPRDVLGAQVPTPCFPRSPEMQLGARDAPIPNGLVSSGLGLEAPSQTAEHDTSSLKSHASRLTDQPPDNRDTSGCCPLAGAGHLVVVKVQDAVSDIVTTGPSQCPFTAYSNPKTHEAPPPAADLGAGDLIDVG